MNTSNRTFGKRAAHIAALALIFIALAAVPRSDAGEVQAETPSPVRAASYPQPLNPATAEPNARPSAISTNQAAEIAGSPGSTEFFSIALRSAQYLEGWAVTAPYTVFVPVDDAFEGMSGEQISALLHDRESLRGLVASHIVPGRVSAADLRTEDRIVAVDGEVIAPRADGHLQVNGAAVLGSQSAPYGFVHIIDRLL